MTKLPNRKRQRNLQMTERAMRFIVSLKRGHFSDYDVSNNFVMFINAFMDLDASLLELPEEI